MEKCECDLTKIRRKLNPCTARDILILVYFSHPYGAHIKTFVSSPRSVCLSVCTHDSRIAERMIMKFHSGNLQERLLTHFSLHSTMKMKAALLSETV
jgi:hypothetical protein